MKFPYSKLPDVGTTIFSVMSKMAADHDALNLSQGFPDFPVSNKLISLVHEHMLLGKNQYAPMPGVMELREAISNSIERKYHVQVNPATEVTITAGATEGIYAILTAIISTDDEVILFDPAYDCYAPAVRLNGGKPNHLTMKQPDFTIDCNEVEQANTPQTKAIIINTPHNPSGAILAQKDLLRLEKIVANKEITVVSDEVYEQIIFDSVHQSALRLNQLRKQSAIVYSFGKTFHVTGWKCGYVIAPEQLTAEIRKIHQYLVFSVSTPLQYALAEYLQNAENEDISALYLKKRDLFREIIRASRFELKSSYGTYFQLLSYNTISDLPDLKMAEKLTKEYKIASIPISVFYKEGHDHHLLRFCFAKSEETLEKAGEILCRI